MRYFLQALILFKPLQLEAQQFQKITATKGDEVSQRKEANDQLHCNAISRSRCLPPAAHQAPLPSEQSAALAKLSFSDT